MNEALYLVRLGRLRLPTIHETANTLGDGLEAVGAVLVPGERRPRPLELTLDVRGDRREPDPKLIGDTLRAQLEALLENPRARLEGLWLDFAPDPLLAAYIKIGGGKLTIDDHSLLAGQYTLELDGAYRVGRLRTHRPARRVDAVDLRLPTTPRDPRGRYYGGGFAGFIAESLIALPRGAAAITGYGDEPATGVQRRACRYGAPGVPVLSDRPSGEVLGFELADPNSLELGDVVIYDRPVGAPEDYNPAEPAPYDPRAAGWAEVYGADQPLNPGDVPVLDNGLCRVRFLRAPNNSLGFQIDHYPAPGGAFVDGGRVVLTDAVNVVGIPLLSLGPVVVHEWTPERAVLRVTLSSASGTRRELWITLQRGWTGPRFDVYGARADSLSLLYVLPPAAGGNPEDVAALNVLNSDVAETIDPDVNYDNAAAAAAFTGREPWVALSWLAAPYTVGLLPAREATRRARGHSLAAYPGLTRAGVRFTDTGWLSMRLVYAVPSIWAEAEAYVANGSIQNDGAASGGQYVYHQQAAPNSPTTSAFGLQFAEWLVAARTSAQTAGGRISTAAGVTNGESVMIPPAPGIGPWGWRWAKGAGDPVALYAYHPTVGNRTAVDRFVILPAVVSGSSPDSDGRGIIDQARQALIDTRATPTLLGR